MRSIRVLFVFIVFLFHALLCPGQEKRGTPIEISIDGEITPLYRESHALIIANSKYVDQKWVDLPGVSYDVEKVKSALEKNDFSVEIIRDGTKQDIEEALNSFIRDKGHDLNNRLLIYFAGHGQTLSRRSGNRGYYVPSDTPHPKKGDDRDFVAHALSFESIETIVEEIESKHVLCMFDACFSGQIFENKGSATSEAISYATTQYARQYITSGSADERVPDRSVFADHFVKALTTLEADGVPDGFVTGHELFNYLKFHVININPNQHPQFGERNQSKGDFVFLPVLEVEPLLGKRSVEVRTGAIMLESSLKGKVEIISKDNITLDNSDVKKGSTVSFEKLPIGEVTVRIIEGGDMVWQRRVMITENRVTKISAKK